MNFVMGIDEVGRGAWAGPLVAGAVILSKPIRGIKDSKLLSYEQRFKLAGKIIERAEFVGLGWAEPEEIDNYGLTAAHVLAYRRAIRNAPKCAEIIIDGNFNYLSDYSIARCLIKADQKIHAVSAASIIAKVARDNYMASLHPEFPLFNFINNVGYGTKTHQYALEAHGPTAYHRRSYVPLAGLL